MGKQNPSVTCRLGAIRVYANNGSKPTLGSRARITVKGHLYTGRTGATMCLAVANLLDLLKLKPEEKEKILEAVPSIPLENTTGESSAQRQQVAQSEKKAVCLNCVSLANPGSKQLFGIKSGSTTTRSG